MECIILSVKDTCMDAQEDMHMNDYNKITALYSRLSVGDEDRDGGERHVAYCSEYHKRKAQNPKCHSPHIINADLLMQTVVEVLKKIEDYSISNRAEFEALVKRSLAMPPLPTSSPPFSTSLSAGLKCMSATRKGRDPQSSTSAYISTISAGLRTK